MSPACVNSYCFVLFLLFSVSSLGSTENTKPGTCNVPPKPVNGDYITNIDDPSPGDALQNIKIYYTCDEGFEAIGPLQVDCVDGIWTKTPHVPECIPYCDVNTTSNIVSCDAEQRRCAIPESYSQSKQKSNRFFDNFSEKSCGIVTVTSLIIAGGKSAEIRDMPWHAGIYTKTSKPYMQICGGTLITSSVVISAAHCFWNDQQKLLPADNYAVALGKQYRPWADPHDFPHHSDVREIKIPPRFQGAATNFQDDIALVFLMAPTDFTEFVKPACLDFNHEFENSQLKDGNFGKVAGWGLTSEDGKASPVLNVVDLPYVNVAKCIAESPSHFVSSITSDKICAGYKNGTAVCRGDSGGGLLFFGVNNLDVVSRYYLRGVVSTAPSDGHLCNVHAWATFTHLAKHERFIRDNVDLDM